MIVIITVIAGLTAVTIRDIFRLRKLEAHITQLDLDVEMLIQNSQRLDI